MDEEEKNKAIREALKANNLELISVEDKNKLGKGGFGAVYKVRYKHNKKLIYAAKIIEGNVDANREKVQDFRGVNIIKINKEIESKKNDLYIIIMELSTMGDLTKLYFKEGKDGEKNISFLNIETEKKILKEPFLEKFGDNLTRFFVKQMISILKTFYQGNLVHYDIKPLNILLFKNLEIKIIDFSFLRNLDESNVNKGIPGGTPGYLSPEYYYKYISKGPIYEVLRAQDYFAVGATIYFLKYGKEMLKYKSYPEIDKKKDNKNKSEKMNEEERKQQEMEKKNLLFHCNIAREFIGDAIIFNLEHVTESIRNQKFQDKDFTEFLCSLIQYKPTDRPDFEHIIRNKWVNKNLEEIGKITKINSIDESNLILELQKSDFLINNPRKYRKKFDEKNKLDELKYINNKKGKFKFGRRK